MITIWKYQFDIADSFELEMPYPARVLSVQMQDAQPTMWACVDDSALKRMCRFHIRGTGHNCAQVVGSRFLGTIQDGPFVWHVFEGGQ